MRRQRGIFVIGSGKQTASTDGLSMWTGLVSTTFCCGMRGRVVFMYAKTPLSHP